MNINKWFVERELMTPLEIVAMFALLTTFICGLMWITSKIDAKAAKQVKAPISQIKRSK